MPLAASYLPDARILELGDAFYDDVRAAVFPRRTLRFRNDRAAKDVGLDALTAEEWEAHFGRFEPLPRNLEKPLALRYHGHQFGVYNPALGDGRGFLFAQVRDAGGRLLDLGTKGSGTTPWSRGGDGRLTLKGGVREILATEMLEALGVKTSRTLSVLETGEKLQRGDEPSPTRSCVLVRLGHSHIRFGTFQRLAYQKDERTGKRGDVEGLAKLVDYSVRTYFPELAAKSGDDRVIAFLDRVVALSAKLAAQWMTAGFCHGVLNTDNMTITGDSFDYGPYRFVPTFDPDFVAAYFDHSALYAFGKQPSVVTWNLSRLADALRPLAPTAPLGGPVALFQDRYEDALRDRTLVRLGVLPRDPDTDLALTTATWSFLESSDIGFEQLFFDLHGGAARAERALSGPARELYDGTRWTDLRDLLSLYEPRSRAIADEPYFQCDTPCTLLIDEIEAIWAAIAMSDDWGPLDAKIADIRAMGATIRRSCGTLSP
jgi:serine/tyrosine/threonine adenylyltransferase